MTSAAFVSDYVTSGPAATLGTSDFAYVKVGVVAGSYDSTGISAEANYNRIDDFGTIVGGAGGVSLGNGPNSHTETMYIYASGAVYGYGNYGISMTGYNNLVDNSGYIYGPFGGVLVDTTPGDGVKTTYSTLINRGTIETYEDGDAVYRIGRAGGEQFNLVNSGTIKGVVSAFKEDSPTYNLVDHISNTGTMIGAIHTGNGADFYDGHLGHHTTGVIDAGDGDDTIYGGSDNDSILGGDGNDLIRAGGGKDAMDGGTGVDIADYTDKAQKVQVTLNGSTTVTVVVNGVAEDSIKNFEYVYGGSAGDAITGDSLANRLVGGGGVDTLGGGAGNDTIEGGAGRDVLDGGTGTNFADYSDKTVAVVATLAGTASVNVTVGTAVEDTIKNFERLIGGSGADKLTGDSAANILIGNAGADSLVGGTGNDTIKGGVGADTMDGGVGTDTADLSDLHGNLTITLNVSGNATAVNSAASTEGQDVLKGFERLLGGAGNDALTGNALANQLGGNAGDDRLWGHVGADTLTGGAGNDKFVFSTTDGFGGSNVDTVTDITHGTDQVWLDIDGTIGAPAAIPALGFEAHAGHTASTSLVRLVYDTTAGQLWYDSDGNGSAAAVEVAQFGTTASHPTNLAAADFFLV